MDKALKHRVNAARVTLKNQVDFFHKLHGQVSSQWKADDTRVTFADFAISERVFTELSRSFPEDQVLSEESVPMDEVVAIDARYAWLLDPVDGTNNYALGMPSCAISLALLKEGVPVYGLIYDGGTGELIEGGASTGLRVNRRKVNPLPGKFDRRDGLVALHFPLPAGRASQLLPLFEQYRVRSLGSAALHLAYVALGRIDGVIDERVRPWDIAAAVCLAEAASREIRYLGNPPFPLAQLDMQGPHVRYYSGTPAFMESMENWLG